MIHDLKPYPAMKDSGVPWLGQVPQHWEVRSLGSLTRARSERGRTDLPLLSVVREKGVILRDLENSEGNHNFIPDDLSNYKVVREGNLVVNKMKAWQGSMGLAPLAGIVSPAYFVFDFDIQNRLFGQALLRSKPYVSFFARASDGVRIGQWDLSIDGMKRIPVVIPPPDEQAAIVRFLDHADRRIRRTIAAKQRLIKLLQEQKQVIIHQAVTRGLDPNVKLKPSGVEWLGDVPEHWIVLLNQRIFKENIRPHDNNEVQLSLSQRDGLIATRDMTERSLQTSTFDNWKTVFPGDLVVNRFKAHLGVFFSSDLRGIVSFHYGVFEPQKELETEYYEYLYHTSVYKTIYAVRSNGMTVGLQNLSNQSFYNVRTLSPPINEQREIVFYIKGIELEVHSDIRRAQQEITLLREYRTRLIADVVTGKLDVREAVARLPKLDAEPLPADLEQEDDDLEGEDAEAEADAGEMIEA